MLKAFLVYLLATSFFAELIFELKRLEDLAWQVDADIATDLQQLIYEHQEAKGDCCG